MVESVGSNVGKVSDVALAPVQRVAAPRPARPVASEAPAVGASASTARAMAAAAPVDTDRVRRIKAAIESGTFPLSPATIADGLIALKYEWMSHDEA